MIRESLQPAAEDRGLGHVGNGTHDTSEITGNRLTKYESIMISSCINHPLSSIRPNSPLLEMLISVCYFADGFIQIGSQSTYICVISLALEQASNENILAFPSLIV